MIRFFFILSFLSLFVSVAPASAQGDWKVYASYNNVSKAVKAGSRIYAVANGGLFCYDTEDSSVEAYDKSNALNDFGVKDIVYSESTKTLMVLYNNTNIDLIFSNDNVWNMPELKNKEMSDRGVHAINAIGDEIFISIGYHIAVVNLKQRYFSEFYTFDDFTANATVAKVDGVDYMFVTTSKGLYQGKRSDNLLDKTKWAKISVLPEGVRFTKTAEEIAAEAEALEKVKDVKINSPEENHFYRLNMIGERLLVAGGNFYDPADDYPGLIMKYEDGKWSSFDDDEADVVQNGNKMYLNVSNVVQDPEDSEHHWVSTIRSGLYEFRKGKFVANYSMHNSILKSIRPQSTRPYIYVRISGLNYDSKGNLWMCNNQVDTILYVMKKGGELVGLHYDEISKKPTFDQIMFDKRDWAWVVERRSTSDYGSSGLFILNTNGTIDNVKDDKHRFMSSFVNQDGTGYYPDLYYCVTEDANGYLWIGTSDGLFVSYDPENAFNNGFHLSQVKVPRNDGTNLADYLLNKVEITCVTIDGGNRKWIGTNGDGVYLVSADGLETLEHFTTANSPLINDDINDIAINGNTGEVFFATKAGLCSYQGDATDPSESMKSSNLKVWPNPVRPEYNGNVHIGGLMANSNVKIISAAGRLVYEGVSMGGEFSWNCCYQTGRRVASGIYYALCTDEEGKEGVCTKVVIVK